MDKLEALQNRLDDWKRRYAAHKARWEVYKLEEHSNDHIIPPLDVAIRRMRRQADLNHEFDLLEAELKKLCAEIDIARKPIVESYFAGLSKN